MNIVSTPDEWRSIYTDFKTHTIGLVPTMGHLHDGHLSLIRQSQEANAMTVVSIFVNATQFNRIDDFNAYPRTLCDDIKKLEQQGVDYLFLPDYQAIYPDDYEVKVQEETISSVLEGVYRPGHFEGMLTVILKLFNIIRPQNAYFGEKDYQQLMLIKKMVHAFFIPVNVVGVKTQREQDGLALSSRNTRLNDHEKKIGNQFASLLNSDLPLHEVRVALEALGIEIDYLEEKWGRRLAAVTIGGVRLIDNIER